jgi:hypothetical protein
MFTTFDQYYRSIVKYTFTLNYFTLYKSLYFLVAWVQIWKHTQSTYPHLDRILAACGYVQASFSVYIFSWTNLLVNGNFFYGYFCFVSWTCLAQSDLFNTTNQIFFHGQISWSMEIFLCFFPWTRPAQSDFLTQPIESFLLMSRGHFSWADTSNDQGFFCVTMDAPRKLSFPYPI